MTYQSNSSIVASDINSLTGGIVATSPFLSDASAINKLSALYGVGYGSRGYGQSAISIPIISSGQQISSGHWLTVRSLLEACCNQTGTSKTLLPPTTFFAAGSQIIAADGVGTTYDLPSLVTLCDTNRFSTHPFGTSLTSNVLTMTRSSTWSSLITGTIRATFSSSDKARYFFNSGGQIRFNFYQPSAATPQSLSWSNVFSNIGTITFSAMQSTISGTLGTATIGYYGLNTAAQNVFSAINSGTGAYTANDVIMTAAYSGSTANGAKGNIIDFTFSLNDQHTNAFFDSVAAGTNVKVDILTSSVYVSGIESPSLSIISNW